MVFFLTTSIQGLFEMCIALLCYFHYVTELYFGHTLNLLFPLTANTLSAILYFVMNKEQEPWDDIHVSDHFSYNVAKEFNTF